MQKIIIAIDGHSSCGKSTLAKALAQKLNYAHINTGAMYRATTLYLIEQKVDILNREQLKTALQNIQIRFENIDGQNNTFLNGTNVEGIIRTLRVSDKVSEVAAIPQVRQKMVQQQTEMGKDKGIVMEGRDIGTVVFPHAELKIFLTADLEVRAKRRFLELIKKGQAVDFEAVRKNLVERDQIDSTRAVSPLKIAEDAIVINNTHLTEEEQLDIAFNLAKSIRLVRR